MQRKETNMLWIKFEQGRKRKVIFSKITSSQHMNKRPNLIKRHNDE